MSFVRTLNMAIQDSDPERRNLIVTSVAFIAYFYAGGSITDTTVHLQVINTKFDNPEVLAAMAWIAFVWFIYRYWQTHSGVFAAEFREELARWQNKGFIKRYVNQRLRQGELADEDEGFHPKDILWKNGFVLVRCIYAKNVGRTDEGRIGSHSVPDKERKDKTVKMTDLGGWILALRANAECILAYPSFSSYVVPYILALIAICGAIRRHAF